MGAKLDDLKQRTIVEILQDSLADKPFSHLTQTASITTTQQLHETQNEVRYKLIIDSSEDESITRLLFMFRILQSENTRTYICSDFLGDGKLQKVILIANVVVVYNKINWSFSL